jgi:hypothetical protein
LHTEPLAARFGEFGVVRRGPVNSAVRFEESAIMEICVFEVDWEEFLATFPKAGDWAIVCDTQIDFDDFAYNIEASNVYSKLRGNIDDPCVKALALLFSAVCINGVPKKLDRSSVYKPTIKFDENDFQFGCDGPVIPRSSPEQIAQIIDAFSAIPKGTLEDAIKTNWKNSKAEAFNSSKEYVTYIKNWIKALKAVKKAKKGLAVDVLT